MAKVDLSSSEWCDLIFSGKNKAYGAYQKCSEPMLDAKIDAPIASHVASRPPKK